MEATAVPVLAEFWRSGVAAITIGSLLLGLAGIAAAWMMAWARRRALSPPAPPGTTGTAAARRWRVWLRPGPAGETALVGRTARWPQAIVVPALASATCACLWTLHGMAGLPPGPATARFALGGAAIVLAFPLLIVERHLAAVSASRLPEAPAVRRLLFCCLLAWAAAGLLEIAGGLGVPFTDRLMLLLVVPLSAIALELALRAMGRCFLPPPEPAGALAAVDSLLARLIADGVQAGGIVAPVRQHLGIDFARGWALAYVRAATPHVALFLLLLCWGLSGVVLVGLDQRAIYERFGAPVAVLHPGLHAILPWPMGRVRRAGIRHRARDHAVRCGSGAGHACRRRGSRAAGRGPAMGTGASVGTEFPDRQPARRPTELPGGERGYPPAVTGLGSATRMPSARSIAPMIPPPCCAAPLAG